MKLIGDRPPLAAKSTDGYPYINVWLDDQPVRDCCEYDETNGFIVRLKRDEFGNAVLSADEFVTERIEGVVRVEWK